MVDFDGLADKAKDQIDQHEDQVDHGLDKAGDAVSEKVGHEDQVDKGVDFVQDKTGDNNIDDEK